MQLPLGTDDLGQLRAHVVGDGIGLVPAELRWTVADHRQLVSSGGHRFGRGTQSVGRAELREWRWRVARTPALGRRRLHGQAIDEIVHGVVAVTLHPLEHHVAPALHGHDERFPEIAVGNRLLGLVEPPTGDPSFPPAVAEAVHDIGRVADNFEGPLDCTHRLEGGMYLHPLVGARVLGPVRPPPAGYRPRPPAGAGIPQAGAVGVGDGALRAGIHWAILPQSRGNGASMEP